MEDQEQQHEPFRVTPQWFYRLWQPDSGRPSVNDTTFKFQQYLTHRAHPVMKDGAFAGWYEIRTSARVLAKRFKASIRVAKNSLQQLEQLGMIKRYYVPGRKGRYRVVVFFNPPDPRSGTRQVVPDATMINEREVVPDKGEVVPDAVPDGTTRNGEKRSRTAYLQSIKETLVKPSFLKRKKQRKGPKTRFWGDSFSEVLRKIPSQEERENFRLLYRVARRFPKTFYSPLGWACSALDEFQDMTPGFLELLIDDWLERYGDDTAPSVPAIKNHAEYL